MSTRRGWQRVKFGDVVRNVSESIAYPVSASVERAVGLEHLDPGELVVSRWAATGDGLTFTRRFRARQVLFGRRRAYQRKVAIADFDGVCSGDIYVLEPSSERLIADLLPFIVQSDPFFRYALRTSAGSLSPRTKWIDLKNFELDLPPVDEQREIAEVLWAGQRTAGAMAMQVRALANARKSLFDYRLQRVHGELARLQDVWSSSPKSGCSAPPVDEETGHFVLSLAALAAEGYRPGQLKRVKPTREMLLACLSKGDLLVSRSNTREMVGFAAVFPEDRADVSFPDTMMRVSLNPDRVLTDYIEAILMSRDGRRHIQSVAAGTSASMKKINRKSLGSLRLVVPPLEVQGALVRELADLRASESIASRQRDRVRSTVARMREELLTA